MRGHAVAAVVGGAMLAAGCGGGGASTPARTSTTEPAALTVPASPTSTTKTTAPAPTTRTTAPLRRVVVHRNARPAAPRFRFSAVTLSPPLRAQLRRTSWHMGCPVALDQLRYLRIAYWDFEHRPRLGEMVVNASAVRAVQGAFARLFAARFPIRRMRLVDRYGGSDYASIEADNTSSFNCRDATGASRWSEHAYGLAIDVDPIENPYVYANGTTSHAASRPFLNRHDVRPGMAESGGTLVRAFGAVGWGWGGRWPLPTDFQHFSVNGR
jgi:D-alanyl-D-alanine carboxypeptidase